MSHTVFINKVLISVYSQNSHVLQTIDVQCIKNSVTATRSSLKSLDIWHDMSSVLVWCFYSLYFLPVVLCNGLSSNLWNSWSFCISVIWMRAVYRCRQDLVIKYVDYDGVLKCMVLWYITKCHFQLHQILLKHVQLMGCGVFECLLSVSLPCGAWRNLFKLYTKKAPIHYFGFKHGLQENLTSLK